MRISDWSSDVCSSDRLIPRDVKVTADGPIQSGGTITVAWRTANDGLLAATGAWADRVIVRNLDSGQVIGNFLLDDNGGVLAAGASRQRQMTVTLPAGNAGVGRISVTVTNEDRKSTRLNSSH